MTLTTLKLTLNAPCDAYEEILYVNRNVKTSMTVNMLIPEISV